MTHVKVKGFQIFKDRHGKWRCYPRGGGKGIDLDKYPLGSPEFFDVCSKVRQRKEQHKEKVQPRPGTLGLLIQHYKNSYQFEQHKPATKAGKEHYLSRLEPLRDMLLVEFTTPYLIELRDGIAKKKSWDDANRINGILSVLFSYAVERGMMDVNPAKPIKKLRRPRDIEPRVRAWTDAERFAVKAYAPPYLWQIIGLMMYTGLRRKDAIELMRSEIKEGRLEIETSKTGAENNGRLNRFALEAVQCWQHNAVTVCANSRGEPWTVSGFASAFRRLRDTLHQQGLVGKNIAPHGLRHSIGARVRELGHDERMVADILTQETTEMGRHYSKSARIADRVSSVMKQLEDDEFRRIQSVKPENKIVKLEGF
jgi:integrase